MIFKLWHKWLALLLVAATPFVVLLIRGVVWGSDSFAFWAVSCGQNQFSGDLGVPAWFVSFIQVGVNCSLHQLVFIQFLFYFFALCAVWIIGKHFFGVEGWRLPVYLGALTPLFFLEAMRFENDFFGWSLALISLGLFCWFVDKEPGKRVNLELLAIPLGVLSVIIWLPSVFILFMALFLIKLPSLVQKIGVIALLIAFIFLQWSYLLRSFNFNLETMIAEEIPFIGLAFVVYLLPFFKRIPGEFKWYGLFLLGLGVLKSKFMFLAVPILLLGVLEKQLKEGIKLKRPFMDIKEIPVLYCCGFLLVGMILAGVSLYPTQSDMNEAKWAVKLAKDNNLHLYNVWGDGWMFESIGFSTKYKISYPSPDWNSLGRPFLAWNPEKLPNCEKIGKRLQHCV
jgi:hypothetical protein